MYVYKCMSSKRKCCTPPNKAEWLFTFITKRRKGTWVWICRKQMRDTGYPHAWQVYYVLGQINMSRSWYIKSFVYLLVYLVAWILYLHELIIDHWRYNKTGYSIIESSFPFILKENIVIITLIVCRGNGDVSLNQEGPRLVWGAKIWRQNFSCDSHTWLWAWDICR